MPPLSATAMILAVGLSIDAALRFPFFSVQAQERAVCSGLRRANRRFPSPRHKRVVYGARDAKAGCCGSLTDLFALPFNHHPVIESGLLEDEAQALLQDFFVMLREKRKKK